MWLGLGSREKTRAPVLVAVLPFVNLDRAPEQEFFSDGLTEEMITQLSLVAPASPSAVWAAALAEASRERAGEALALLEKVPAEGRNPMVLNLMSQMHNASGRKERVRQILAEALAAPYPQPYVIAAHYLRLDNEREAVKWFERAFRERDSMMVWMRRVGPGHRLWKYA